VVASIHWSVLEQLDASVWARWIDSVDASKGEVYALTQYYDVNTRQPQAVCRQPSKSTCTLATPNTIGNDAFRRFKFLPMPPEVRAALRFHLPRGKGAMVLSGKKVRDPLKDDVFDVEVDGSYTANSAANTVEVRFKTGPDGLAAKALDPQGFVPGNADRWNGYKDSFGIRLGGQVTVIPDKFGIRAGTWIETRQQDPAWLTVTNIGAQRGGVGGGLVFRQDFLDISVGYQFQWSSGLNNNGNGLLKATVGSTVPAGNVNNETGTNASNYTQWRTPLDINGVLVKKSGL